MPVKLELGNDSGRVCVWIIIKVHLEFLAVVVDRDDDCKRHQDLDDQQKELESG